MNQTHKAQVKDGKTNKRILNLFFNKTFNPNDLVIVPDISGNGAAKIALLGSRATDGHLRLFINDSKTGTLVGTIDF